jgi:carbonic anhydrase
MKLNEIWQTTLNIEEEAIEFWRYESSYITYHSPSEHTINGEHYDLEMQLHHTFAGESEEVGQTIIETIEATIDTIEDFPFDLDVRIGEGEGTKAVISIMFK